MKPSEIITSRVTRGDMLAQLAEECCELAQAALKLRRTFEGTSPTPVTQEDAEREFREEIADVLLTMRYAAGLEIIVKNAADIDGMSALKKARWARRLSK